MFLRESLCLSCRNYIRHAVYGGGQCAADPVRIPQTYNSCVYFDGWKSERDREVHTAFRQACDDMAAAKNWEPLAFGPEDWTVDGQDRRPPRWSR